MEAHEFFAAKLAFETDVSDVHTAQEGGEPGFVLVDSRSRESWDQGHARGAVHIPLADIPERVPAEYPAETEFVVYCWGPGCNGATRGALAISALGLPVREMIGGFEYWAREGLPVDSAAGDATRAPDPLTAPGAADGTAIACAC